MKIIHTLIVVSLALGSLAGTAQERPFRARRRQHNRVARAQKNSTKTYTLEDMYQGESFLKCVFPLIFVAV